MNYVYKLDNFSYILHQFYIIIYGKMSNIEVLSVNRYMI